MNEMICSAVACLSICLLACLFAGVVVDAMDYFLYSVGFSTFCLSCLFSFLGHWSAPTHTHNNNPHTDTLMLQGNNFSGNFTKDWCEGTCIVCNALGLTELGLDCDKIVCEDTTCCKEWENCFYNSQLGTE
jgi:hypothetical protein